MRFSPKWSTRKRQRLIRDQQVYTQNERTSTKSSVDFIGSYAPPGGADVRPACDAGRFFARFFAKDACQPARGDDDGTTARPRTTAAQLGQMSKVKSRAVELVADAVA